MQSSSYAVFDTREPIENTARREKRDQECQTDVDMASLGDQINQNRYLESKASLLQPGCQYSNNAKSYNSVVLDEKYLSSA